MQLRLSLAASMLLAASAAQADNYVSIQYMGYDEDSGRTTIHSPAFEVNVDLGADYTLNLSMLHDSVSGASPTYYDASSGASATLPPGVSYPSDIVYGDIPYEESRDFVGARLTRRFASRDELTLGLNRSSERDYLSREVSLQYLHYLDETKNESVTLGASWQRNDVDIYCFMGTGECDTASGASSKVKTENLDVVNLEVGYTRILTPESVASVSVFAIDESGYLTNPYLRVVRNYDTAPRIAPERKPDSRRAYGFTLGYDRAWGEGFATLFSYRYYDDDWGIVSHTFDASLRYRRKAYGVALELRGYTQSAADFFSGRRDYFTDQKYASSDRRISEFDAYDAALRFDWEIAEGAVVNLGVGYYDQPEYFHSVYYNAGMTFSF